MWSYLLSWVLDIIQAMLSVGGANKLLGWLWLSAPAAQCGILLVTRGRVLPVRFTVGYWIGTSGREAGRRWHTWRQSLGSWEVAAGGW